VGGSREVRILEGDHPDLGPNVLIPVV
jgi:hypothetical protein